ncbi:MAG TPA: S8 family serine peptidase [Thermoanaerobaculia bacterium]|nr:S8 family serine peptidase [Thermoanaerobaculia bacterium]
MRKLFVSLLIAATASANEVSYRSLQSGRAFGGTPLHDRGLHGEGQIVAVLDTGLDYTSCYFAEPDGSRPPINTRISGRNVDLSRRKVVAYNFLYSCDEYPGAPGCDDPSRPGALDNQGHGTHAAGAIAGDQRTPIAHDYGDAIATGARLIIQDAGFIGGDNCSQRPGIGCPVNLTPILTQAYEQGARIHSNSWGDRQQTPPPVGPPTANYPASARDLDAFVYTHPEMLVVFNTGNYSGGCCFAPPGSLSAPGSAKNTLQVGGTRTFYGATDDVLSSFTLIGPTRDGRIKPDVVGPAYVVAADARVVVNNDCGVTSQPGTSWASPTVAGAAALVRQYYTDGFYPSGIATPGHGFTPSAALVKATVIASARAVPMRMATSGETVAARPVPSYEQGFGFPVLDDALYFPGDRIGLRVFDVTGGIAEGQTSTLRINVRAGTTLKAILDWTDPPGTAVPWSDTTPQLVNDLDLTVTAPAGGRLFGNETLHPGTPDRVNNVEGVIIDAPESGTYTITVSANRIRFGARQSYALVITGDLAEAPARRRAAR